MDFDIESLNILFHYCYKLTPVNLRFNVLPNSVEPQKSKGRSFGLFAIQRVTEKIKSVFRS